MRPGELIQARVVEVQPYGVWIEHAGQRGLVQIVDLSWDAPLDPFEFVARGDELDVVVLRLLDEPGCSFLASVKDCHPEGNPWRDVLQFSAGLRFRGVVSDLASYGYFVAHPSGAKGLLPKDRIACALRLGDEIEVRVESFDPAVQKLILRLA